MDIEGNPSGGGDWVTRGEDPFLESISLEEEPKELKVEESGKQFQGKALKEERRLSMLKQ